MTPTSALVRVLGPDPKLAKAAGSAFYQALDGTTILSASGLVLPVNTNGPASLLVVCPLTPLFPFIRSPSTCDLTQLSVQQLLPMVRIDVLWQGSWVKAQLDSTFRVHQIADVLSSWLPAQGGNWRLAWGVGGTAHQYASETVAHMLLLSCNLTSSSNDHTRTASVAALQTLQWTSTPQLTPGMQISAVGSPFGALSPGHFADSMIKGVVSNTWPALADSGTQTHLLTADIRSMPGMEGGPVFNDHGELAALMLPPLLSMDFRAEVPLLVPFSYVADALPAKHQAHLKRAHSNHSHQQPAAPASSAATPTQATSLVGKVHQPAWSQTLASLVLLSMPGSGWASGIILNKQGFILTNAHVIQPRHASHSPSSELPHPTDVAISVRLKHAHSGGLSWHNAAVVYVFQHALDMAVIRLKACEQEALRPAQLSAGPAEPGQPVAVIGHALFSPDCQMQASITASNITQVVYSSAAEKGNSRAAAMLMTSATVHAGASGGAVVATDGSVAGLVTSNARYAASGAIIPNLNFAVAAEALRPIWALAEQPGGLTEEALQGLDVQDKALASLWKLTAPPEQKGASDVHSKLQQTGSERLAGLLAKLKLQSGEPQVEGRPPNKL